MINSCFLQTSLWRSVEKLESKGWGAVVVLESDEVPDCMAVTTCWHIWRTRTLAIFELAAICAEKCLNFILLAMIDTSHVD